MPLSFALSISHFVSSVGADAGFAALIGLAVLVLLYFAHARETSNLRSELLEATQRLEQLERRQSTGVSPTVAPRPPLITEAEAEGAAEGGGAVPVPLAAAPPAAAAGAPSGTSTGPLPPPGGPALAPPAGVGAPPLTDATRVVPGIEEEAAPSEEEAAPSEEVPDERPAEAPVAAMPLAAPQGTGAGPLPEPAGPPAPPPPGLGGVRTSGLGRTPAPMTAAAGGNGISPIGASAGTPRSLLEHGLPGQRRALRWVVPLLGALVVIAIAVVLVVVLSSGSSNPHHATIARHSHSNIAPLPRGVVPSAVTVAVVNGTNINQLAHHVGSDLSRRGFKEGTLATATGQTLSTTSVGYLPGHRNDALAVAHALKLPAADVRPAAQASLSLVCPSATSCTADVVVVTGTDIAHKR